MGENRQIRSRTWNRIPTKRFSANGIMPEFIVLDEDDVIILDDPESSKGKAPGTSRIGNESISQRVISLDDDDDDDDTDRARGSNSPEETNLPSSAEADNAERDNNDDDDDDCQFVQEKCATFRFSKCKQTFSTGPSSGIRFGLDSSDSDSDYSDSDESDCEILEGPNGKGREQWEKAFLRKARNVSKAGPSEEAGPSDPRGYGNFRPGFEDRTEQHYQTSSFFPARNHPLFGTDDRNRNKSFFGPEREEDNRATNRANSKSFRKQDFPGPSSHGKQVEHERSDSHFTSSKQRIHQNGLKEVEKQPDRVQVQRETTQPTKENQKSYTEKVDEEDKDASKSSSLPQSSVGVGGTTPVVDTQTNGARREDGFGKSREPTIDPIPSTSGKAKDTNPTAPAINIMLGREKMKETDEYKKAQEEEWESRQRQLQIQAEEAQRQRKRRKLETMRQLEMERRQKERIEEVRETQKKDEETMNMKEKIRAEVTKSLNLLELKCMNMASLLRGLGIHVSGGLSPLPNQVHAAYRLALLKFHPDRASSGDIKQQVEAEEIFKLIARMKDKFKSAS